MARSDTSSTLSAQSQRISEVDESLERIQSREYESQRALDEKPDPYLVLFSENDPDNPKVPGDDDIVRELEMLEKEGVRFRPDVVKGVVESEEDADAHI